MSRPFFAGLAICGSLVAAPGCDWGPFDTSPEPAVLTVTDYEFRVGRNLIKGQVAISIENQTREPLWYHGCGSSLARLGSEGQWQGVWSSICTLVIEEVPIGHGEVLDTALSIHAFIAEDSTGWTTPIDGTYRLCVFIRRAHAAVSTDGCDGVLSRPFPVAADGILGQLTNPQAMSTDGVGHDQQHESDRKRRTTQPDQTHGFLRASRGTVRRRFHGCGGDRPTGIPLSGDRAEV